MEQLHRRGKMPDWAYYQLNDRTAEENFFEQREKLYNKLLADKELELYKSRRKAEIDEEIDREIEKELPKVIQDALDDIFSNWQ